MTATLPPPPVDRVASSARRRAPLTGWLALGTAGLGATILAARQVGWTPPPCVLLTEVGQPCPVCGITRAADALAHGQVTAAVTSDPLGVVLLVAVAALALVQLLVIAGRTTWRPAGAVLPVALGALVVARWGVLLVDGGPAR